MNGTAGYITPTPPSPPSVLQKMGLLHMICQQFNRLSKSVRGDFVKTISLKVLELNA